MGTAQSIEANLWSSSFQLQSKNSKVGIIKLTDKQTQDVYICRKISTLDKKHIQEIDRLIDLKLSIESPYITKLQRAESQKNQQQCAYGKNYFLLFKQPYQTLKQQTLNRKFKNSMYSQAQLELMLQVGVKALSFLKNVDHSHQNISSTAFFINQNRSMVLGDPFMFPKENSPQITRNGFVYPSPQIIKFQNGQIESYNEHLSDLFTLGLVLLQVFYMINMDCVYERYFQRVNYDALWARLNPIKDQQLKKKLFILLDPEPKNRQTIYKYYVKSISSVQVFSKISKQKFKRNIDRYNLATSQVTQWKNELPFQTRLNSSQGKKTFSVSTAENVHNQDKTYNYYQKQYGQANKFKPLSGSNFGMEHRQPLNNYETQISKNNRNQYTQSNSSQVQNRNKPIKLNNSVKFKHQKNGISQVNSNGLPSQGPIISKPIQINTQHVYSIPEKQNYQLPTSTFTSPFSKSQKPYNFGGFSTNGSQVPLKIQPSLLYNTSYRPQINSTNYLINSNLSSFTPKIYNFNSLSVPSYSFQSITSPSIPDNSLNKPLQISKQSYDLQKNHQQGKNQQSIKFQQFQMQHKQIQLKIAETSINSKQTNSESTNSVQKQPKKKIQSKTPTKQKIKRTSLDYGKFQHLSTINQRSELTQSFISDAEDRKSQILIQQDETVLKSAKNNPSQETQIKQQTSSPQQDSQTFQNCQYLQGTAYKGQMKNNKRNGLGTFFYVDGCKYHGQWLDNKMHGFGTLYYPSGKIAYQGEWKLDDFHGKGKVYNDQMPAFEGKYHYEDCTDIDNYWLQYDGQFFEDRKEGRGILKLTNGQYFDGRFRNDYLHGLCKFYTLDKKIIEGVWENSKLIKIISERQNV